MLEITRQFGAIFPTLAWDENRAALIDAGFPGQIGLFTEAITGTGIRVEEITDIILTHQDIDHIGCVREVLELAPSAKMWSHPTHRQWSRLTHDCAGNPVETEVYLSASERERWTGHS